MPPWPEWYVGRGAVGQVFAGVWRQLRFRLVLTAANRQPALAMYARCEKKPEWEAHAIQLLSFKDDAIAVLTTFRNPRLFAAFGLSEVMVDEERLHPAR